MRLVPLARGLVLATALLAAGCADPTQEARIAALGPEDPLLRPGPLHRPGQPCLVCHDGGAASLFSAGGTIYRDRQGATPAADATVLLVDAAHTAIAVKTNCAGNFFVPARSFAPTMPLWASLRLGEERIDMESPMHKDGDCAACHGDPAGPTSAGPVFVFDGDGLSASAAAAAAAAGCP